MVPLSYLRNLLINRCCICAIIWLFRQKDRYFYVKTMESLIAYILLMPKVPFIYWSQLWVKTLHFQCNTLVMRKNRVSSANLSNLPALRHGLAKEDFQSERKTPVLSVQGGLVGINRSSKSELAGLAFSPSGKTLFVNIQENGETLAITGPWEQLTKQQG